MAHKDPYPQILLFGDSITQHSSDTKNGYSYFAALSHTFQRRFDVINRGFSGYNTRHGLHVLEQFMPTPAQAKIALVTICFGANDACFPHVPTGHHVSLADYASNLAAIINHPVMRAHSPAILLLTPPPLDEHTQEAADRAKGYALRRTAANTKRYADACHDVGKALGVPVVDIWGAFARTVGWQEGGPLVGSPELAEDAAFQALFSDGLHLSDQGYRIMFREVMAAIEEHYPHLMPEQVPFVCPSWETLNGFKRPA